MSRRKQTKPRHLEGDGDLPNLLENGSTLTDETTVDVAKDDAHVCGKCCGEFFGIDDFLAHKKTCMENPVVLTYDETELPKDVENGVDKSPPLMFDDEDDMSDNESNININDEIANNAIADMDISEDEYGEINGVKDDDLSNEEDEFDEEKKEETEMMSRSKLELMSQLPHLFPFLPNNNVTIEPLPATKAAVAQFAENNMMPQDVAVMSATLYNLQQQQLVQLQLIQQLQHQLMSGMTPPTISAIGAMMGPHGVQALMAQNSVPTVATPPAPKVDKPNTPEPAKKETEEVSSQKEGSNSGDVIPSSTSPPAVSTPLPSSTTSSSLEKLQKETALPASSSIPSTPNSPEFRHRGTMLERNQYASDDPFFKHKCRFCHKVFGSDSALQIHVRSHTGERPFKCHICGNRFSTKGNLKVHFERHKQKYPNAKMNPYPQPEHLERPPPPSLLNNPFTSLASSSLPSPFPFSPFPALPAPGMMMTSLGPIMPSLLPATPLPPPPRERRPSSPFLHESKPKIKELISSSPQPLKESPILKSTPVEKPAPPKTIPLSAPMTAPSLMAPPSVVFSSASLSTSSSLHLPPSRSLPATPISFSMPTPLASTLPLCSTSSPFMPQMPSMPLPPPTSMPQPHQQSPSLDFRNSILPSKMIDPSEDLEKYMECSKSETSKLEALVKNIEQKITDPNQCVICHRILSCKSALQMHYRIHTGERPYKCKICSRAFTTKGNLKTHMGVHRAKPPLRMMHQCPVCHKQFTNLLVLQQHIRMHTGEAMSDMPNPAMFHHQPFPSHRFDHLRRLDHQLGGMSGSFESKELDLSKHSAYASLQDPSNRDRNLSENSMDDLRSDGEVCDEDFDDMVNGEIDDFNEDEEMMDEQEMLMQSERCSSKEYEQFAAKAITGSHHNQSPTSHQSSEMSMPEHHSSSTSSLTKPQTSTPRYSASLAALEERVKAIDSQMSQASFERFRNSMGLDNGLSIMNKMLSPGFPNSERSPATSPKSPTASESGSERSGMRDEGSHLGYPVTPDGMMPFGLGYPMLGALDLRPGEKRIHTTCHVCFKTFACKSALEIHLRSHTKERPFHCEVCDRSFSTRGNMRQHMLTHKIRDIPSQALNEGDGYSSKNEDDSNWKQRSSPCIKEGENYSSRDEDESRWKPITNLTGMSNKDSETFSARNENNSPWRSSSTPPGVSNKTPLENNNTSNVNKNSETLDDHGSSEEITSSKLNCDDEKEMECEDSESKKTKDVTGEARAFSYDPVTSFERNNNNTPVDEAKSSRNQFNDMPNHNVSKSPHSSGDSKPYQATDMRSQQSSVNDVTIPSSSSSQMRPMHHSSDEARSQHSDSRSHHHADGDTRNHHHSEGDPRNHHHSEGDSRSHHHSEGDPRSHHHSEGDSRSHHHSEADSRNHHHLEGDSRSHHHPEGDSRSHHHSESDPRSHHHPESDPRSHHHPESDPRSHHHLESDPRSHHHSESDPRSRSHPDGDARSHHSPKGDSRSHHSSGSHIQSLHRSDSDPRNRNHSGSSMGGHSSAKSGDGKSSSSHHQMGDSSPFMRRTGPKHQCMTCMKTFSSASALQIHTRTHTGDKPFKCEVCGKAFTTKGNQKVHMGTHMWNNSPSRRGRRMSIEPPFMMSHVRDNPFLASMPHRPPDFYFQYPHFMNGLPPKMNEISVIQSVNGGLGHVPPSVHYLGFGMKDELREMSQISESRDNKDVEHSRDKENIQNGAVSPADTKHVSMSGELDLSVRPSSSASSANSASSLSSPSSKDSPPDSMHATSAWLWKSGSCHFCSQTFPSAMALEQHIQSHHRNNADSQKALVA